MKQTKINNSFFEISKKYEKIRAPRTLRGACVQVINKYKELIRAVEKEKSIPHISGVYLGGHNCGLCRFYKRTLRKTDDDICDYCILRPRCETDYSSYDKIYNVKTPKRFITIATTLIKQVKEGYKKKTKKDL